MTAVSVSSFSKNAAQYAAHAIDSGEVISVTSDNENAMLLSEEEYRGLLETIRLMNCPGMDERVKEARRTPAEERSDFVW